MNKIRKVVSAKLVFMLAAAALLILTVGIADPNKGPSDDERMRILESLGVEDDGEGCWMYNGEYIRFLGMYDLWDQGFLAYYTSSELGHDLDIKLVVTEDGGYELVPWPLEEIYMQFGVEEGYEDLFEEFSDKDRNTYLIERYN